MGQIPRITFGTIVLNGEPFIKYNLRALYPFAHQIIVVEGASPHAHSIATQDGHSTDDTLEILRDFKRDEDPDNKIQIVTAEDEGYPNGFWPGEKHEQSQAYAKRATGNWLWQVDVDEFYMPQDMTWIIETLLEKTTVSVISFKQINFWGSLNYYTDGWFLRYYFTEVRRLFRWEPGYIYLTHRPPTVINFDGVDLANFGYVRGAELKKQSIYMYHYSLVFPQQVNAKSNYYSNVKWGDFACMSLWSDQQYNHLQNPYRVHNVYQYPSWLERYSGAHPPQVMAMWKDIQDGRIESVRIRPTGDIESLLTSRRYTIGKFFVKITGPIVSSLLIFGQRLFSYFPDPIRLFVKRRIAKVRGRS